jgi:hypothetical protein
LRASAIHSSERKGYVGTQGRYRLAAS